MREGVNPPLIVLLFTPEKDKYPHLIIIRSLAQIMRFKKEWLLDCLDLFTTQHNPKIHNKGQI